MEYNKLVRDKIPEIIRRQGETPVCRTLSDEEYILCLEKKLDEEVAEYHESGDIEELADILEVIFALCKAQGRTKEALMAAYQRKHEERGGFAQKVFLIAKQQRYKKGAVSERKTLPQLLFYINFCFASSAAPSIPASFWCLAILTWQ